MVSHPRLGTPAVRDMEFQVPEFPAFSMAIMLGILGTDIHTPGGHPGQETPSHWLRLSHRWVFPGVQPEDRIMEVLLGGQRRHGGEAQGQEVGEGHIYLGNVNNPGRNGRRKSEPVQKQGSPGEKEVPGLV